MNIPWKTMIFLAAAGMLSISPLPLKAQGPEPGDERTITVEVGEDLSAPEELSADAAQEFRGDVLLEVGEEPFAMPGEHRLTLALEDPPGKGHQTKRIVIRTDGEDRPRLGVVLRFEKSTKTDSKGAYVQGVTPGSPADEAGVKVGDIIVKFNGKALAGPSTRGDEEQSAPAQHLVEMARKLRDGEKVSLEILRGDKTLDLDVVARKLKGNSVFSWDGNGEDLDIEKFVQGDFPAFHFNFSGDDWLDMELVSLDPDLGEYFGTTDGLLVVKAPDDPSLGIKAGDVIQKIGDRKPTGPSQAFRILSSYEPGDSVTLEVLRKQRRQTLQFKVPDTDADERHGFRHPRPPVPPTPPAPPAPAAREVRRG